MALTSEPERVKGLERDVVFLVGMCEGVFPDYRAQTPKEVDEERNSAFVAVTRARRWLYISYSRKLMMPWGGYKDPVGVALSQRDAFALLIDGRKSQCESDAQQTTLPILRDPRAFLGDNAPAPFSSLKGVTS